MTKKKGINVDITISSSSINIFQCKIRQINRMICSIFNDIFNIARKKNYKKILQIYPGN